MMNNNNDDLLKRETQEGYEKHKFQKDFCQTYETAFIWRFGDYIDLMQRFAEYLGSDKLIEMIKHAVDERYNSNVPDNPEHTFKDYIESGKRAFKT
jgi:hypothetical protein